MRSCNEVRVPLAGLRPRSCTLGPGLCPGTLGPGLGRKPAKGALSQLIVLTYIYLCVKLCKFGDMNNCCLYCSVQLAWLHN